MSKCRECGTIVGYMKYFCERCRKKKAGTKPRKSKSLCSNCKTNWYNLNKEGGCWSYKGAKVVIKDIYYSPNQVVPDPIWTLSCHSIVCG